MEAIPDCPEEIDIQLQRADFIARKLIDRVADEIDEDVRGEDSALEIHKLAFGQAPPRDDAVYGIAAAGTKM